MASFLQVDSCTITEELHFPFTDILQNITARENFLLTPQLLALLFVCALDIAEDLDDAVFQVTQFVEVNMCLTQPEMFRMDETPMWWFTETKRIPFGW